MKVRLLICNLFSFNISIYIYKFPFKQCFSYISQVARIVFLFPFISKYFPIFLERSYLANWLFRSMLFNFHIFVKFPNFLLLFISKIISLWLENALWIPQFLNLLKLVLWFNIKVYPGECSWEECLFCSCWVKHSVIVRFRWFIVLFKTSISLLSFCTVILSITEIRFITWFLLNCISPLNSVSFCLRTLGLCC